MAKSDMDFKNSDLFLILVLGLFIAGIYAIMRRYPAGGTAQVRNTESPLPSGLYTSGSVGIPGTGGMNVKDRVNFEQQPYGGPTWG